MSQKNQLKNQNKNQSLIYKKLSNKKKREAYINSLPTIKKVPQIYLKKRSRAWLKECKQLALHPLRKNFPVLTLWFTRFANANVFELLEVKITYSKKDGAKSYTPELLERKLLSHPQYLYNNKIGWGYSTRPMYPVIFTESLSNINSINRTSYHIVNKHTPFRNYVPDKYLRDLNFTELQAPHLQTIYEYCPELMRLYCDNYNPGQTLLQTFECFENKKELHNFFKYFKEVYATPNNLFNFNMYRDFVYECKKRKENYLISNWYERHEEHIEENNKLKEAQEKKIDKKLRFVKHKLFKMPLKEWNIYFEKPKTQNDLKEIGKEMSNCVGMGSYKAKDIIIVYVNDYMICLEYKNKKIKQVYTYKNNPVPTKYKNYLEKEVIKWTKNLSS